jgi:diadenosine tetraphosphate (Ap4A) HIT family hydrolase
MAMLTSEQIEAIKTQLIEQINLSFPEEKKEEAMQKVEEMNERELENFLEKNKLIKQEKDKENPCIFCSIVSGKIPCHKIAENKKAIGILEINPISKAHALVLPKAHFKGEEKIPNEAHTLAKEIGKKIKSKLKPKQIKIFFSEFMGHEVINVLPVYLEEKENSPRKKADDKELEDLKNLLEEKKKIKPQKIEKISKPNGNIWLPKRIP